jgi:hypothetical protein
MYPQPSTTTTIIIIIKEFKRTAFKSSKRFKRIQLNDLKKDNAVYERNI